MTPRVLIRSRSEDGSTGGDPHNGRVALDARQRHYLIRVLRLDHGAAVQAFDGAGHRWAATLGCDRDTAWLTLDSPIEATPESPLAIRLGQCLSGADKMDWTIEKAVELGVHSISPLSSQRSQIRIDDDRARKKLEHWRAIAEAACMQSGRDLIPAIDTPAPLTRWLGQVLEPLKLVLDPRSSRSLSEWLAGSGPLKGPVCVLVGPESGLSETELAAAQSCGFVPIQLGARVLRTETAGLAAIAALQALAGDF